MATGVCLWVCSFSSGIAGKRRHSSTTSFLRVDHFLACETSLDWLGLWVRSFWLGRNIGRSQRITTAWPVPLVGYRKRGQCSPPGRTWSSSVLLLSALTQQRSRAVMCTVIITLGTIIRYWLETGAAPRVIVVFQGPCPSAGGKGDLVSIVVIRIGGQVIHAVCCVHLLSLWIVRPCQQRILTLRGQHPNTSRVWFERLTAMFGGTNCG